jgi:hypothetical protein
MDAVDCCAICRARLKPSLPLFRGVFPTSTGIPDTFAGSGDINHNMSTLFLLKL